MSGPTHFYGGLSFGNTASMTHSHEKSNPKQAALEGLRKMRFMMELGIPQALFPPHDRPSIAHLRMVGYSGSDNEVLEKADPELLALFSSSSSMWAANAASVTPSQDSLDGKLHLTAANLATEPHRSIEAAQTTLYLQKIFPFATIHPPLPSCIGDEGAANQIRLEGGTHLFVYGRSLRDIGSKQFPARQYREASEAIIRSHQIKKSVVLKQSQKAIDAGVFHNDVIAMGYENLFIYHEEAFEETPNLPFETIRVTELSLEEAVKSYLFNSQIARVDNQLLLIAPKECENLDLAFLPFDQIHYVDLRQSMHNGGGPACLRLSVLLNKEEISKTHPGIFLTPKLYETLETWVNSHYRDSLNPSDLRDPQFLKENREALDQLTKILDLGSIYPFQT